MKWRGFDIILPPLVSSSTRGTWIEIRRDSLLAILTQVVLHPGDVD